MLAKIIPALFLLVVNAWPQGSQLQATDLVLPRPSKGQSPKIVESFKKGLVVSADAATINGASTIVLRKGQRVRFTTDGFNYFTSVQTKTKTRRKK